MRNFWLLSLLFVLASCHGNKGPDVSKIQTPVTISRFDKAFFSMDTNNLAVDLPKVEARYPAFFKTYTDYLSPLSYITSTQHISASQALTEYIRNIKPLYDACIKKYPDLSKTEKELSNYFRYVKYYFPEKKLPAVVSSVESLNPENKDEIYGTSYFSDTVVISLQMYLGKDFPAYDPTYYFDYLRRRFEPQYMAPNVMRAIAQTLVPDSSQNGSLIELMINKGKEWYVMKQLMPDKPDSMITYYTGKQLEWCKENEGNIWAFLTKQTDIYTLDPDIIQNYIGEGPFTPNMVESASPGNIGPWIGLQIIRKYLDEHADKSLKDMLNMPAKTIFAESRYHPK